MSRFVSIKVFTLSYFFLGFDPQVFTVSQKASASFQLGVRLFQGLLFTCLLAGLIVAIVLSPLTVGDVFAVALALIPTVWGLLSVRHFFANFCLNLVDDKDVVIQFIFVLLRFQFMVFGGELFLLFYIFKTYV